MILTVGSVCTGYGGLELALDQAGIDHRLAWCSEIDEHASKVIANRFPTTPNLGDINYANPTPVDVITAGFPCQDISYAGRQAGLDGERSGLWWRIRDVIGDLRPRYVVLENVAAILTNGGPAVVGSLAGLGYDCRWGIVRASDVGAPHQRARWFCVAWNTDGPGLEGPGPGRTRPTRRRWNGSTHSGHTAADTDRAGRLQQVTEPRSRPAPVAASGRQVVVNANGLVGSPPVSFGDRDEELDEWDGARTGAGHITADRCLRERFGRYAEAVHRWEQLTRPAPNPTHDGKLNPQFVEWMMGLPAGWVTGLETSRAQMLRILGGGVVPQQASLAIRALTRDGVC